MYVYDEFHMKEDIKELVDEYNEYSDYPVATRDYIKIEITDRYGYDDDDLKAFDKVLDELVEDKELYVTTVNVTDFYSTTEITDADVENIKSHVVTMNESAEVESTKFELEDAINELDAATDGIYDLYNSYIASDLSDGEKKGIASILVSDEDDDKKAEYISAMFKF